MMQGTTPTHTFNIPFSTDLIEKVRITYAQHGVTVLTKEKEDCQFEENKIICKLTQEDTLKFDGNTQVEIQIKVRTVGGEVPISKIMGVSCERVLDRELI